MRRSLCTVGIVHTLGSVDWRSLCYSCVHCNHCSRVKRILKSALPGFFGKVMRTATLSTGQGGVKTVTAVHARVSVLYN